MPSRTNFVIALNRSHDLPRLVEQSFKCFSAQLEGWLVVGAEAVHDLDAQRLRETLDGGRVVLAVTNREPVIRAHLSTMGEPPAVPPRDPRVGN